MRPIERLLAKLPDAKQNGKEWSARCPAHDDRRPSLSVAEGDDGRALVDCKAGCVAPDIVGAVGLTMADLFPEASSRLSTSTETDQPRGKRQIRRPDGGKPTGKSYPTANAAIAALERQHGERSAYWTYHDAQGKPVGVVVRWDKPDGKDVRPLALRGDAWVIGGMPEPRPLYGLPDLSGTSRVFIVEGEKAADAARALGLTATTSPHGAQSHDKANWQPLAGRECVLLPDNDEPGSKYAEAVATILGKLSPPAVVKVVELPDLPKNGDIADWIAARPDTHADELRREVEALADNALPIQPDRPATGIEPFRPFPTEALPKPIRGFVEAGAKAIGCDTSYLALPLLTALAAAIGSTRRIQLKRGWTAPAIIWTAIVGESGTAKTPAFKLVMKPIRDRQSKSLQSQAEAMKQHDADLAHYEKALAAWKRDSKTVEPPPEKPEPPQAARFVVSDTTIEALAPLLLANPRGLLLACDELAGWIGSFDRYSSGKGSGDSAKWLSMHNGEHIVVDRKTGMPRTIFVPQAAVCVCGGIQPGILNRALGSEHRESGLAARLLLACPPRRPKQWTEADIPPSAEAEIARLFGRLYNLQPTVDDEGEQQPVVLRLTPDAKSAFVAFVNAHGKEQASLSGDLSAAWSKLEEYAARLALVIHFTRWAADDPTLRNHDQVDVESMKAGIALVEWFKDETRRVYSLLSEPDDASEQRQLIEWIGVKGGAVTVRDVQQGNRRYATAQDAKVALEGLIKAGCGNWEPTPTGQRGRPTRRFMLSAVYSNTKKPEQIGICVDVDTVDAPVTQSEDDWGEV